MRIAVAAVRGGDDDHPAVRRQRRPADLFLRDLAHRPGRWRPRRIATIPFSNFTGSSRRPAATTSLPSREKLTKAGRAFQPLRLMTGASSLCQISLPVAASQTRTNPSAWPVTIRSPDGDHAAEATPPTGVLSSWCSRRPVDTSKSPMVLSIGMATSVPSGENAGRRPHEPGSSIVRSAWPVAASRMRSRLKSATATCRPSGDKAP